MNEEKLKGGLGALVKRIESLRTPDGRSMTFGIWVEPEHVNPQSELYEKHPDWVLHAGSGHREYPRVAQRNQYILDLSKTEVQDFVVKSMSDLLSSARITYVKWDCNKAIEQLPTPSTGHAYLLGLYCVLETLTAKFPEVLWEGCASGGGRFDPGILCYWPGSWTSDNTDPVDRLHIQAGTSMVYPPSAMSGHVSASPNHQTGRSTPLRFRAHVAMLCGSFGLEMDPNTFSEDEARDIAGFIKLSEKISPYIVHGDLYRLSLPAQSNWPAFLYVMQDKSSAVLLAYQIHSSINVSVPAVRLAGLDVEATYSVDGPDGKKEYKGDTLMNAGIRMPWRGDYQSSIIFLDRV